MSDILTNIYDFAKLSSGLDNYIRRNQQAIKNELPMIFCELILASNPVFGNLVLSKYNVTADHNLKVIESLLSNSLLLKDIKKDNGLYYYICSQSSTIDVMNLFIQKGIDLDDVVKLNTLLGAIFNNNIQIVRLLIELGVNLSNMSADNFATIRYIHSNVHYSDMMRLLIINGVDHVLLGFSDEEVLKLFENNEHYYIIDQRLNKSYRTNLTEMMDQL